MKKFNLNITMLLLLSCVGTAFSMEEDITKEQQQKVLLGQLEKYRERVTELNKNLDKFKEQHNNGLMSFDDYHFQRCSIAYFRDKARSTYETSTGLDLGYTFNIETTDLKKFAESDFVERDK